MDKKQQTMIVVALLFVGVLIIAPIGVIGGDFSFTKYTGVTGDSQWSVTTNYADGTSTTIDESAIPVQWLEAAIVQPSTMKAIDSVDFAFNVKFNTPVAVESSTCTVVVVGERADGVQSPITDVKFDLPAKTDYLLSISEIMTIEATSILNAFPEEFENYEVKIKVYGGGELIVRTLDGVKGRITVDINNIEYPIVVEAVEATAQASGSTTGSTQVTNIANLDPGDTYTQNVYDVPVTWEVNQDAAGNSYSTPTGSNVYTSSTAASTAAGGGSVAVVGTATGMYYIPMS